MITKMVPQIDIFVSSPGDLMDERGALQLVVERLNRITFRDECLLVPARFEVHVPPEVGDKAQFIVNNYMKVQKSHILICMLWTRMGTPFTDPNTGKQYESGTYYEFLMGYEHLQQHRNPRILLYRKVQPNSAADAEQKRKVDTFFKQFVGESAESKFEGIFSEFSALDDFINAIESHLHQVVRKHVLTTKKHHMVERPEFEEEPRRIDAAIPKQAALGETTMLRVMVCLPDSEGLRESLPESAKSEREVVKDDVRKGTLMVAFPKDPKTGELQSTEMKVEVSTSDFEFEDGCSSQTLRLAYKHDSGLLAFALKPRAANKQAKITIRVKGPALDGGELIYGTILLQTEITETVLQTISGTASRVISTFLGVSSEPTSEATLKDESDTGGIALDDDSGIDLESLVDESVALSDDDSEIELSLDDADFADEEDDELDPFDVFNAVDDDFDEDSATVIPSSPDMGNNDGETFDLDEDELSLDDDGDVFDADDDAEFADDDDADDDVFDDDAEFEEGFCSGESHDMPYVSEIDRAASWGPAQLTWTRILLFVLTCVLLMGGLVGLAIYYSDKAKDDTGTKPAVSAAESRE